MEREESLEEGRTEEKREMVINGIKLGFPIEKLAQQAKVSLDVVKQWIAAEEISMKQ